MSHDIVILIAGVVAGAAPILMAALGETLTEKAGMINLSLDGTILLSAMAAFVTACHTQSTALGFAAGGLVGALVAALVAVFSLYLGQNQVAVGFVLTLMTRDLAYFLGNAYSRIPGPQLSPLPIPVLKDIPVIGAMFFRHNLAVYASMALIIACWWVMYRTSMGLRMRAVGEHPRAAFARGMKPDWIQGGYALAGGFLVGLAGAAFSLSTKPGWGRPQGAEGTGWIALALVIFGGWDPFKVAVGAYLFAFLQVIGIPLQGWFPSVPAQVFQVAPFPLMIFTLLLITAAQKESVQNAAAGRPRLQRLLQLLSGTAPAALGKPYQPDD